MALMPKESAKLVARLSKNVFIEEEGVENLACMVNTSVLLNLFVVSQLQLIECKVAADFKNVATMSARKENRKSQRIINNHGLSLQVLEGLKDRVISVNNFSQLELHPSSGDPRAVDWIFVLDTLNYSFWTRKDAMKWTVNGQTGYFALCAAVKRAIDVS